MDDELSAPASADVKKIRLNQRYHLIGNDCIVESATLKPLIAKILDLSHAGALIVAKKNIGEVGDVIDVSLQMNINEENKIFKVRSVIHSARTVEGSDMIMSGVEFIDIDSELNLLLKNYIYKSMTE